jgi:hypothetical protein
MSGRNGFRLGLLPGLLAALLVLMTTGTAHAAITGPATSSPSAVTASFVGWTMVAAPASALDARGNVAVWKWTGNTTTPWAAAAIPTGSFGYRYPMDATWSWLWVTDTWYAVPTSRVASYSCTAPSPGRSVRVLRDTYAYARPSTATDQVEDITVEDAASLWLGCAATIPDNHNAVGGAARTSLVSVWGRVHVCHRSTRACGYQNRWVYVQRNSFA